MVTDDFDVDGGASSSQFVLQSNFVHSGIGVKAAVDLQVTGNILLPVQHKQSHQPLQLTRTKENSNWTQSRWGRVLDVIILH